jgi:hypothetical protein
MYSQSGLAIIFQHEALGLDVDNVAAKSWRFTPPARGRYSLRYTSAPFFPLASVEGMNRDVQVQCVSLGSLLSCPSPERKKRRCHARDIGMTKDGGSKR